MRVAILTSEFPSVSETFVLQHVCDLLDRGHGVEVYPERPAADGRVGHSEVGARDLLARRHLPPPLPHRKLARARAAARLVWAGSTTPLVRSLNPLAFGRRGASGALLFRAVPFLPRRRFDVVHAHHGPVGLVAAHLRRLGLLAGPLVVSFHGHDVNVVPREHGPGVYAPLFRAADLLLANSRFLVERLRALGAPPARVVRHPLGVRLTDFQGPAQRRAADGELRLLSVARLVEAKGIDVALRALARLAPRHLALRYEIVGDGPERTRLTRLASELGIAGRVRWLGARSHDFVRARYARAHVFCLPSVVGRDGAQESQGLALVEAQAAGLPVLGSAIGGIPESLRNGETGFLVRPGDDADLAARLEMLLRDAGRREAFGAAGRRFVARRFDRDALAERLLARYARLAVRGGRAGATTRPAAAAAGSAS